MTLFGDNWAGIAGQTAISNWQSFRAEARFQRVCASCGATGDFQAHHVVYEQILGRYGFAKPERYDTRNALRICPTCHERHHTGLVKIQTRMLRDENVVYAFIVLGPFAADWLRRYYDDGEPDPRIQQLESEHDHPALHRVRSRSSRRGSASTG